MVTDVVPGGAAHRAGVRPGDVLESVDGQPVQDVFDYRIMLLREPAILSFLRPDGSRLEMAAGCGGDEAGSGREAGEDDEDPGLSFADPLMDHVRRCRNKCVFCFVDQLPQGLRKTLYFKDDDLRLSFLHGNYVTLTNVDDRELDRILRYRLSPVNLSIHTTDPVLRVRMMGNPAAADLLPALRTILAARLPVNAQLVLVPGWNDGEALDQTLETLLALTADRLGLDPPEPYPGIQSIAAVPVGLTRHRSSRNLPDLRPYDRDSARDVLDRVDRFAARCLAERGSRVVFAADEFYLRAERPLPDDDAYEDFPQLENGVGLVARMRQAFRTGLAARKRRRGRIRTRPGSPGGTGALRQAPDGRGILHLATGVDAAPLLSDLLREAGSVYDLRWSVHGIPNRFFGETVTVAGLLAGQDVRDGLHGGLSNGDRVLVPSVMLRSGEDVFLDDMTLRQLENDLGAEVVRVPADADGLLAALDDWTRGT